MANANVFEPDFDANDDRAGFVRRRAAVGRQAGAQQLGATLHDLPPGATAYPYHFHYANEELMVVLSGSPRCAPRTAGRSWQRVTWWPIPSGPRARIR
jgi:uncharacterized cupin superfamily protein